MWTRSGGLGPGRGAAYAHANEPAELGLRAQVALLDAEVSRLRELGEWHAAAAEAAQQDAEAAQQAAEAAEQAAVLAQQQLGAARGELAALRTELAALREELVWAFAERKLSTQPAPAVIELPAAQRSAATAAG